MTGDGAALLRGVLEAPDDDAPRLVMADWLEENGQQDHAELIRVQCRSAKIRHNHQAADQGASMTTRSGFYVASAAGLTDPVPA